ncbi:MAG: hypothetical protein ACREYE_28855, partial [Gammaproteobacteria bacterium]
MIAFSGRGILLDIEGTTSSIAFVTQTLFAYARRELSCFLAAHWDEPAVTAAREQMAWDADSASFAAFCARTPGLNALEALRREVERLMDADAKLPGLKQLQGLIWRGGYQSGVLKSHLFRDVPPALAAWAARGLDIRIYSSEVVNFSIFAAISRREGIPAPVRQARVECRLALAKPANSPQT